MDNRSETGCGCIVLMILITVFLLPFLLGGSVAALALAVILLLGALHQWVWRCLFAGRGGDAVPPESFGVPASEDVIDVEARTVETRSADPQDRP